MNKNDPYATTGNPVTAVRNAFGTLPADQQVVALAAALIEAGALTEEQLRTWVFRVSGTPR